MHRSAKKSGQSVPRPSWLCGAQAGRLCCRLAVALWLWLCPPQPRALSAAGAATPPRRDIAAEMREPGETLRHWMDVRVRTRGKSAAVYRLHVYVPQDARFQQGKLWDNVPQVLRQCAGWTIVNEDGIPLSDPVQILQVLDAAQNIGALHRQASGEAKDGELTARIRKHLLGAAKKDHNDTWRTILSGLATADPLKQAMQAWLRPAGGPGTVDKRAEARAIEAYRTAMVLVLPDLIAPAPEMGGAYDALKRAYIACRPELTGSLEPTLNSQVADLEKLAKLLDCKPDSPVGMSVRDGVKFDPPAGTTVPAGRYWYYPYEGAGVAGPLDDEVVRAARPVQSALPPSVTRSEAGAVLRAPGSVVQIPVQGTGRFLIPSASLNASYVDRIAAWQTRRELAESLERVKAGLQILEPLTVASAVLRAYSTRSQTCLDEPGGELLHLSESLARGSAAGSDGALLAGGTRQAVADVRDVTARTIQAAAAKSLRPGDWSKARDDAMKFLLERVVQDPGKKVAVSSALSIGLAEGPRALGLTEVDRTVGLCLALACIERQSIRLHNAIAADAGKWSPTEPPGPQDLADASLARRLALAAAGWFYRALHDLVSDPERLPGAKAAIRFPVDWASWDLMKSRPEHFAWLGALPKDAEQELAAAGLPVPGVGESLQHRRALLEKYRTYLPGTGPRLDGVWRAKAYSNKRPSGPPAGQPTAQAEVIAYLYSRPDGSFEGRMYTWWRQNWRPDKPPPEDPQRGGYDGAVDIRGRCVWGGETYFTIADRFQSPLWVEDKGWKGHLSTDGMTLAGTCAGGLPLTLQRLRDEEVPARPPSEADPNVGKLDVVFCIDKSGSMLDDIRTIQMASDQIVRRLAELAADKRISLQVGLVTFSRHDEANWIEFWKLTRDVEEVRRNILAIRIADPRLGAGGNEDLFGAMMYAMNEPVDGRQIDMGWRRRAAKIIIPLTDEPPDEPDWEGRTLEDVARTAEALDPVHMYPLLLPKQGQGFSDPAGAAMKRIASATGGQTIRVSNVNALPKEMIAAIELAIERHRREVWREQNPPYVMYGVMIGIGVVIVLAAVAAAVWHRRPRPQRAEAPQLAPHRRPDPTLTGEADAHCGGR